MAWISKPDVDRWFTYAAPSQDGTERIRRVRAMAKQLAELILEVSPRCADQSAAIRKLREVVMVTSAAIALEQPKTPAEEAT